MTELQNDIVESLSTEPPPRGQAEAASTHMAVLSVERWDDVAQTLQPNFPITAKDALDQAIPVTAAYQSRIVDALRLSVAAGFPQGGSTTTTTTTEGEKTPVTVVEKVADPTVGEAPEVPASIGAIRNAKELELPTLPNPVAADPFLRYTVANSLFQEVTLLNRALTNAKVRAKVEAYLVRIQVAVIPYRRELAYDAYSDLSFYLRPKLTGASVTPGAAATLQAAQRQLQSLSLSTSPGSAPAPLPNLVPTVVPLLVTDSVETATDAASGEFIAELAAAVSGSVSNVGIEGKLQGMSNRLQAAFANRRNSLRTVARLGENAIRVRLGASLQAGPTGRKAYELIPRTHTISMLVLVPRAAIEIGQPIPLGIVERTVLKDARRGEEIPLTSTNEFREGLAHITEVYRIAKRFEKVDKENCALLGDRLLDNGTPRSFNARANDWVRGLRYRYIVANDYEGYSSEATCVFSADLESEPASRASEWEEVRRDVEGLWQSLVSFQGDYAVHGQTVELPGVVEPELPDGTQTVVILDDGSKSAVARIPGGTGLAGRQMAASLDLIRGHGQSDPALESLKASAVEVSVSGVAVTLPSLAALRIGAKGEPPLCSSSLPPKASNPCWAITLKHPGLPMAEFWPTPGKDGDCPKCTSKYTNIRAISGDPRTKRDGKVEAVISSERIIASNGEGKLAIGVSVEPGVPALPAFLRVSGAEIASSSSGDIDEKGRLKLAASTRLVLGLRNLSAGTAVKVEVGLLVDRDGKTVEAPASLASKSLTVVEREPAKPSGTVATP